MLFFWLYMSIRCEVIIPYAQFQNVSDSLNDFQYALVISIYIFEEEVLKLRLIISAFL